MVERYIPAMARRSKAITAGLQVGYARCSTDEQDVAAQRAELAQLGAERIYVDRGLSGGKTAGRDGLAQAIDVVRAGDTLVVTKLDRFARSVIDARTIADDLAGKGVTLQIGATMRYDPADPMGKMFFTLLAMFAEFELDMIRQRTREGMAIAKAKGRLRGKPPKLKPAQEKHLVELWRAGRHTGAELAELFGVARSTVYRAVQRAGEPTVPAAE